MVGIVLMGLEQINYEIQFYKILLVDSLKNIFNSAGISHFINWMWANLPILSPILLVIFVSVIFILIYLYHTSELMNKKKLITILIIVIFLLVLTNLLIIRQNRPPKVKFRLTLVPVQSDSTSTPLSWMGNALSTMITRQLQHSVADQAIVSPIDWTQAVVQIDSIHYSDYLKKLNNRIKAEYILISELSGKELSLNLTYQMIQAPSGAVIINRSILLDPQKLPDISSEICNEILSYFKMDLKIEKTVVRYTSPNAYQKYLAGKGFYEDKKYQFAIDFALQAMSADSGLVEAYRLIGKCYFMIALEKKNKGNSPVEEFEKAREWLSQAVAIDSSCDEAYNFLGEYYIYNERWSLAEQMLIKAYHLNPNNPRLYLSLSRLHQSRYQKLGFKNEKQLFDHSIFVNPCYEDAYLMLSDYYLFENKREQAIRVLEKILEINPKSVPVLMALGKIYLVKNEILKIVKIYNRVLEFEPDNSDAYYNLGILYYNSKDYDNAEKFLKRALSIDNHLNAHLYLAYLYETKGEYDHAIEHLRKRIRYRKGLDDEFAEEARKHLFKLLHPEK